MKFFSVITLQLFVVAGYAQLSGETKSNIIDEKRFIPINGIQQWVTIKGDRTKPAVLFLHGGPGSPLTPYADAIYSSWEEDFVLIQWDQRGTGRTYGHSAPEELTPDYLRSNPLTLEQVAADGIELAKYLTKYLNKDKLILFGTSWGSAVGVTMAQMNPELFHAYIGHSQVVHPAASDVWAFQEVLKLAKESKDQNSLEVLRLLGEPPYDTARNVGKFNRILKKYQESVSSPPRAEWFKLNPEYDNAKDNQHRSDGDDYSFVNYAGDARLSVESMSSKINFLKDGFVFKIPVFLIQGEHDLQTPYEIAKKYYEKIVAPAKEFIVLPDAAHGFNQSVIDTQLSIIEKHVLPTLRKR